MNETAENPPGAAAQRDRALAIVAAARVDNALPRLTASALATLVTFSTFGSTAALFWFAGLVCVILCDRWIFWGAKQRLSPPRRQASFASLVAWVAFQSAYGNVLAAILWLTPDSYGPTLAVLYICAGLANAAGTLRYCPPLAAAGVAPTAAFLLALPVVKFMLDGSDNALDLLPLVGGLLLLAWGAKLWNGLIASDAALARAEAAAAREKQAEAAAAAARTDTIRRVLGDIRTPLLATNGLCEGLRRAASTPAARDQVNMLVQMNGVLNRVVDDLTQLDRQDRRALVLPERVDPRDLVRSATAAFRTAAIDKCIELFLDIAPDAPAAVETDPVRVRLVLSNMIANAVMRTMYGGVRARFSVSPSDRERCVRLVFSVADTGSGLSRARLAEVLANDEIAEPGMDQALLNAVRGARVLGGDITAMSEQGEGSLITFTLDVLVVPAAGRNAA